MTYDTFSTLGPTADTGVDTGSIQVIPHNPLHPNRLPVWPEKYPELIRPTNDKMGQVTVSDETWTLSDVDQTNSNRLYLHHQPMFGSTITVSDGVLNSALTDYENGIVYFSTLPTGSFTVSYLANPDKYYGEYLESIHDLLMKITQVLGAGTDEGIRNAQLFVNALPARLKDKLPNAISFQAIDRNIVLASSTDPGAPGGTKHTFTIGNYQDTVAMHVPVCAVSGIGSFGESGGTSSPDVTTGAVQDFINTGLPYVNQTLRLAVYGDAVVHGSMHVLGELTSVQGTRVINTTTYQQDAQLGTSTVDKAYVAGDLDVTGGITALGVTKDHRFDRSIVFTDGTLRGLNEVCLIDTLDPSLVEKVRKYWAQSHARNCVIEGRRTFHRKWNVRGVLAANQIQDGNLAAGHALRNDIPTGTHYYGKYSDGEEWYCAMISGADAGVIIPVADYDTSTQVWTLTRNLPSGPAAVGDAFYIFHKGNATGNYIEPAGGTTINIIGHPTFPLVAERLGVIKMLTSTVQLTLPASGDYYVMMSTATATGAAEETAPTFFYSAYANPSDQAVPIGHVRTSGSAIVWAQCYMPEQKFDSLWMRWTVAGTGYDQTWGSTRTYPSQWIGTSPNIAARRPVSILLAPQHATQTGPDLTQVEVTTPEEDGIRVQVPRTGIVIDTSNAGALPFYGISDPLWMRVIVGEL